MPPTGIHVINVREKDPCISHATSGHGPENRILKLLVPSLSENQSEL